MQYHASSITADGAYHCPVGSMMAIFITVLTWWCSTHLGSQRGRRCCLKSRRNCRPLYLVIAMIIKIIIMIMIIIMLIMLVKSAVEVDDLRVRVDRAGNMRCLLFRNSVDHLLVGQAYRAVWAVLISIWYHVLWNHCSDGLIYSHRDRTEQNMFMTLT